MMEHTLTVEATGCYDVFGDDVRETLEDYCCEHVSEAHVFVYSFKCDGEQVIWGSIRLDPHVPYDFLGEHLRSSLEETVSKKADKCHTMELYYSLQTEK